MGERGREVVECNKALNPSNGEMSEGRREIVNWGPDYFHGQMGERRGNQLSE